MERFARMTNQSHAPAAEPDEALGHGYRRGRKLRDTLHRVRVWITGYQMNKL